MANSIHEYKTLIGQEESTIQVHVTNPFGDGKDIMFRGLITSELVIAGGANYESLYDTSAQDALTKNLAILNSLGDKSLIGGADVRLVTFAQTASSYINSDKIKFSVECVLVAIKPEDNPLREWRKMLKLTQPRFLDVGVQGFKGFMKSPTNYRYESNGSTRGTAAVKYSTWFSSFNQLITNVSFNPSKVVTKSGAPLYVSGTIQFEPYRALEQGEYDKYFIR